jgi:hypothetical protein
MRPGALDEDAGHDAHHPEQGQQMAQVVVRSCEIGGNRIGQTDADEEGADRQGKGREPGGLPLRKL